MRENSSITLFPSVNISNVKERNELLGNGIDNSALCKETVEGNENLYDLVWYWLVSIFFMYLSMHEMYA